MNLETVKVRRITPEEAGALSVGDEVIVVNYFYPRRELSNQQAFVDFWDSLYEAMAWKRILVSAKVCDPLYGNESPDTIPVKTCYGRTKDNVPLDDLFVLDPSGEEMSLSIPAESKITSSLTFPLGDLHGIRHEDVAERFERALAREFGAGVVRVERIYCGIQAFPTHEDDIDHIIE